MLPADLKKLPLPDPGPIGHSGHMKYIAKVEELLEAEYLSGLTRVQKQTVQFTSIQYPDWASSEWVPYREYAELQARANQLAWHAEQAARPALIPTRKKLDPDLSSLDRLTPGPVLKLKPELVPVLEPSSAQWDLWQRNLRGIDLFGDAKKATQPKADLLYWYLETLLPKIAAKGTIFAVIYFLWKVSPEDLSSFKMSNRKLAKSAGVNLRRIPDAIRQLEKLGVLNVVTEGKWSDLGPKAAVIPEYSLVPLEKMK